MTDPQLPVTSPTDRWLRSIDDKLGVLIDILGGGAQPAPAEDTNGEIELVEPKPRTRQRTRNGRPA